MARVSLFHWNADEAKPLAAALKATGHSVDLYTRMASVREVRDNPPKAILIDLSRLPSHGRELAIYFRSSKKTQHVPIVFIGGEPDKVDRVRALVPDATYASVKNVRGALRGALAKPVIDPVTPARMMQRYGDRTTAQKLGVPKDSRVTVIDPPGDYAQVVGPLPEGAWLDEEGDGALALWFLHGVAEFQAALPQIRRLTARNRVWTLWRKGKRDGLDGNVIRQGANALGMVDYKICSLNATWSGMALTVKKAK